MGSRPISRLAFLDTTGQPIDAPLEWTPALVVIDVDLESWADISVTFQGLRKNARLQKIADQERVVVEWPRAGTGTYRLLLSASEISEERTVTIRPLKLSEEAYGQLIDDLENRLPVSIAIALQNAGAMSGIAITASHETTLAQELQRLVRAIRGVEDRRPGLAATLRELALDPHRILQTEHLWVDRGLARRPVATALAHALVRGGNLAEDLSLVQVVDQRVEHTYDVYENRLVRMFHHQVSLRLRSLRITAEARNNTKVLDQVLELDAELRRARMAAHFLDEVTLPDVLPMSLTMVLLRRPPYRAALEGFLEFNRGLVVQLDQREIDSPLENLPALYQTWNTFVVIETLLEIARERGLEIVSHRLTHRRTGELFVQVLPDGRPVLKLRDAAQNLTITVTPEFSFAKSGPYRSVSFTQKPDIIIEFQRESGSSVMVVLDPKYKLDSEFLPGDEADGRPKKEDIDKMHAYRDAIRDREGNRPVAFAGIMYPGGDVEFGDEIAALSAIPGRPETLKAQLRALVERNLDVSAVEPPVAH